MGISFSCPLASYIDLENSFQSVVVKSISFGDSEDAKTAVRSISFKRKESNPEIFQSQGCGNMIIEGRVSLKATEDRANVLIEAVSDKETDFGMDNLSPKHEAAIKLQKVYKSFRTRRKLADCAVLIEQSWWKLLDYAELKHSSISFFGLDKHETALSRWSRARTRAAKVGKGLSKNSKARKLALQHWLEAIDPRHRYGHNLHFYYVKWLHSQSKEPFFYWLDIGEGKEVNLVDKCPRSKLQSQCIKYLGPMERQAYEVIVEEGKFLYKQSGELVDTRGEPKGAKWIFVLSTSMNLYVGQKKKGSFQHSSFLAGGAATAAGRIVAEKGMLKAVWPHSGHYQPTPENFQDFISFLRENSVDLADVKMDPEEEEELSSESSKVYLRSMSSVEDLSERDCFDREEVDAEEKRPTNSCEEEEKANASLDLPYEASPFHSLGGELTDLSIPDRDDLFEEMRSEEVILSNFETFSSPDSFVSARHRLVNEQRLPDEEDEENRGEVIPKEAILERINSHKGMDSYQLGKHSSCKWTTGAGPRIVCLRDYPPKLQFHCLEKANLSPRSGGGCHFRSMSSLQNRLIGKVDIKKTSFSGELSRPSQGISSRG